MRLNHQQYLRCPHCQSPLNLAAVTAQEEDRILAGALECTRCSGRYPVVAGVPRFVPARNYAEGFGLQWNRHARTQYDSHTGVPLSEERFFATTAWPRDLRGETVLEAGSGAGRFTEQIARTGALTISMDYSSAVAANYALNGHNPNILIVQADLYQMPFARGSFDRVVCLGVLQHTPDVRRAFLELPQFLKAGGSLAIDVYRRFRWTKQWTITKYWVRPLTKRLPPQLLYRLVRTYVQCLWPIATLLNRVPYGNNLNWRLLIADYRGKHPLSEALLKEWAVLDSFDMLAPAYDQPQTLETVRGWFSEAGLTDVHVGLGHNGIVGRGRRPLSAVAA